jgi:spore maturation protein CgeB
MIKNILIIGPKFYNYNESIQKAFYDNGINADLIVIPQWKYANLFSRIVEKREYFNLEQIESVIKKTLAQKKYDGVLFIKGNFISLDFIKFIKNKNRVFLWLLDSVDNVINITSILDQYEKIFVFEESDISKIYNGFNKNVYFLPIAADTNLYKPLSNIKKEIDISFIGSLTDDRLKNLFEIIDNFGDKRIEIFGKRYLNSFRPIDFYINKRKYFHHAHLPPEQVNLLYNMSKICLNFQHPQSKIGVNPRFFEILASKSLQIVNKNEYIDRNFNSDEVITYSTKLELINLIRDIFDNFPDEIVENGFKKVQNEHTFRNRIKKMIEIIES